MTENGEAVSWIIQHYLRFLLESCDPRNDWLTHLLDPTAREALFALGQGLAAALGC